MAGEGAAGDRYAPWQPARGLAQIPLWPVAASIGTPEIDGAEFSKPIAHNVGGRGWTEVGNVARPTMTIYPARGRNTGAAILVLPGGGYQILAIDLEGSEVCEWASARGITCALLKYRVPQTWWHDDCHCERLPVPYLPLADAERAMSSLRLRAAGLRIDPHKIGVVGFSAGGHLATALSNASERSYRPIDAADAKSSRPDFAIVLYPGHLWSGRDLELDAFDAIRADCPPTFIVQAKDDPVNDVRNALAYSRALERNRVAVETHIFARGGHAFGLRQTSLPITRWPSLALEWLKTIGVLHSPVASLRVDEAKISRAFDAMLKKKIPAFPRRSSWVDVRRRYEHFPT